MARLWRGISTGLWLAFYGLVGGALLGAAYGVFMGLISLSLGVAFLGAIYGAWIGGVMGTVLGILDGAIVGLLVGLLFERIPTAMLICALPIFSGVVTVGGAIPLLHAYFNFSSGVGSSIIVMGAIPALIAGIAAGRITHWLVIRARPLTYQPLPWNDEGARTAFSEGLH